MPDRLLRIRDIVYYHQGIMLAVTEFTVTSASASSNKFSIRTSELHASCFAEGYQRLYHILHLCTSQYRVVVLSSIIFLVTLQSWCTTGVLLLYGAWRSSREIVTTLKTTRCRSTPPVNKQQQYRQYAICDGWQWSSTVSNLWMCQSDQSSIHSQDKACDWQTCQSECCKPHQLADWCWYQAPSLDLPTRDPFRFRDIFPFG
jgi:hypothetical protein